MSEWIEKPLGQLAKFQKGRKVETSEYLQEGFDAYLGAPSLEKGNVEGFASTNLAVLANPNDVLMLWDGERSGLVGHGLSGVVSSTVTRITSGNEITGSYLYYHLLSRFEWIQGRRTGTGVPHVPKDLSRILKVIFPCNIDEQERITTVLASVDVAIERTEALIEKYQQIKAGLMHDLFTRGIGADGKLRPPREQAPALYQQTPIGWIPKEWSYVKASTLCYPVTKGTTPPSFEKDVAKDLVPYLRVENLSFDGSLIFDATSLFVSERHHLLELRRSRILPGDILMNIVGPPLGKVSLVPAHYPEWNANQAISIFRVKKEEHRQYLLLYLLSEPSQKWLMTRAKQTSGQVNLTLEMCNNLEVPIPSKRNELLGISKRIEDVFELVRKENEHLNKLKEMKSGLMHDLLTGKVRVKLNEPSPEMAGG